MKHTIRRTMLVLGGGVVVQRLCQLTGFLLIGHALGVAGLGVYAQGQALAAVLTVLAGAGIGNLTARTVAAAPGEARALIGRALRHRVRLAAGLASLAALAATGTAELPWFWALCALQAVPAAFDLKHVLDASGRTRHEVGLETATAVVHLLAVVVCVQAGVARLEAFAAVAVLCRAGYAAAAVAALRRLPIAAAGAAAPAATPRLWRADLALGQLAHELVILGDVWLVALAAGDGAAGLYAAAARFAAAATMPSAQLARLLFPHLLRAGAGGASAPPLGTALRATALTTLPLAAGGVAVAEPLCRLGGEAFGAAAPALQLLLVAGCLQHLGWQCSNTLLASYRDRAYAHGFFWPALLHVALLGGLGAFVATSTPDGTNGASAWHGSAPIPATAALLAAAAAALAHGVYAAGGLAATRDAWRSGAMRWHQPLLLAAGTAAAAALPSWAGVDTFRLPLQLAAGALAFGFGLWRLELRGRWRRLGDGLAAASGLRA